jgi:uncharacterized protein
LAVIFILRVYDWVVAANNGSILWDKANMRKRITLISILIALFVIFGGLTFAVNMYFDYLWFVELGKAAVFSTTLYAKSVVGSVTLLISFLFVYLNLAFANRGPGQIELGIPTPTGQITAYRMSSEAVRRIAGLLALAVGLLMAINESDNWETLWQWFHRVPFNVNDPVFLKDVSFYFFTFPLMQEVVQILLILSFLTLIGMAALYYFKGVLAWKKLRNLSGRSRVGIHISLLAAFIFILLSANAYLSRYEILFSEHEIFSGASYTDLHARLPMLTLLAVASLAGALLLILNAFAANNKKAIAAVVLYFLVLFLGNLYPAFVQKIVVKPSELDRESPQITNNIKATLQAYGLSEVEERNLSGDKALTPQDIANNMATIHSIRLWDHEPLLDALKQLQEIRLYYDFISVDNDRYEINNELQQIMLSPRELNASSLPERNWINERLSYTHGYGLALGPVNRVTSEGLPELMVKDIPPAASIPAFKIERPEIYFGELTQGYAVVKTQKKEFDYPSGEDNVFSTYQGTGGVPVKSFFRKLLFALYFKEPNILLSPYFTSESRFLYFRELQVRAKRIVPFLMLDKDPYMVISEGKLFWVQDAYTKSERYPYSRTISGFGNYIRNSVKIVMDAYNGSIEMYVSDPQDPLIQVYQNIFPGIFRPISELSPDLRRHLRYPEDIFRVQTAIYTTYHMNSPQTFFNKEDMWEIPKLGQGDAEAIMAPYYTIMRLPQEKQEEFIQMIPFTPTGKSNLSAWMVARSDGENYGKLAVYRFPKQKLIYGPKQISARISQDTEISRQISLWDQRGSQVILGNLLVIPIEEGLLYVRPLYLRAESGKIPELKRVIVAYENRIAMEETLEASISKIFQGEMPMPNSGASAQAPPPTPAPEQKSSPANNADLIQKAGEAYEKAINAQKQGETELKKLGEVLDQLKKSKNK